jgi:hypothetical protein
MHRRKGRPVHWVQQTTSSCVLHHASGDQPTTWRALDCYGSSALRECMVHRPHGTTASSQYTTALPRESYASIQYAASPDVHHSRELGVRSRGRRSKALEPPALTLAGWTLNTVLGVRLALGLTCSVGVTLAVPHTGFLFTVGLFGHVDILRLSAKIP